MTRLAMFTPGPQFFRSEDGTIMFVYQVDASNMQGPRKATDADYKKYPEALDIFFARDGEPLAASSAITFTPKRGPGRPKRAV